jgi:hypothetical protein
MQEHPASACNDVHACKVANASKTQLAWLHSLPYVQQVYLWQSQAHACTCQTSKSLPNAGRPAIAGSMHTNTFSQAVVSNAGPANCAADAHHQVLVLWRSKVQRKSKCSAAGPPGWAPASAAYAPAMQGST